jgi:subtilisin-like proprotein convertase family protein
VHDRHPSFLSALRLLLAAAWLFALAGCPQTDDDNVTADDDDATADDDDAVDDDDSGDDDDAAPVDLDGDGVASDEDCDDLDPDNFPGNDEVCDGDDNDCDGELWADEADADLDGQATCEGDCDDADPDNRLGGTEMCDDSDNDCDGLPGPEEIDDDGDGVSECDGDCDDDAPATFPANAEVCDGIDNDCDEATNEQIDSDGDGSSVLCGGDCDDADASNFPGNLELCDGADNDCDGLLGPDELDGDGDGQTECDGDCDDADPDNFDGNPEVCDDADNDCDGLPGSIESDLDNDGQTACDGDCNDLDPDNFPGNAELCDGEDNDCSGLADDALHPLVVGDGAGTLIPADGSDLGFTTVTVDVPPTALVVDLDVRIDLEHSWDADLTLALASPAGTVVTLSTNAGGEEQDLIGVRFDDDADALLADAAPDLAPFTGRWLPESALSAFDGEDPTGTWTLVIEDCCAGDSGLLLNWELHLNQAWDGSSADCPAIDCASTLAANPAAGSGSWWIDPLGLGPFEVECEMTDDGGGWIVTALDHSDQVLVGSNTASNPWTKCADNAGGHYDHLGAETSIEQDFLDGDGLYPVVLAFLNPATGIDFTDDQLAALRWTVSEQSALVRMVAMTADDDSGSWQGGDGYGHEVYAYDADGELLILTPGTNGECGGSSGWPYSGSQSAFYLWSSDPASTSTAGSTASLESEFERIPASFTLPHTVELIVQTGGGSSFGWEDEEFLVR